MKLTITPKHIAIADEERLLGELTLGQCYPCVIAFTSLRNGLKVDGLLYDRDENDRAIASWVLSPDLRKECQRWQRDKGFMPGTYILTELQPYGDITKYVPHARPQKLPPLVPLQVHVTMDTTAHLPSTWRQAVGKRLTSHRIAQYQREGWYGSGLKLPPTGSRGPCTAPHCKQVANTRYMDYGYLPKPGVYCRKCREAYRLDALKQKEQSKAEKEAFLKAIEAEYV